MREEQEVNNVMRDLIVLVVDARYVQQELGHRMAQHRAKDVQPDSSQVIICLVSIVQQENILSRSPVHARSAASGKFPNRSPNRAQPAKPGAMRKLFAMFARNVRLGNTPERKRLRVPHALRD